MGCKDLADALEKQCSQASREPEEPQIHAWVFLPERVTLRYLALLTEQNEHSVCMRLSQLRILFTRDRGVAFSDAKRFLRCYGIEAAPREDSSI